MTNTNQLKREIEIVRRALRVDREAEKKLAEDLRILREYEEWEERATKGMTLEEKGQFQHSVAKQVAKDYVEGKL